MAYDHSPILLRIKEDIFRGRRISRFEDFWLLENSFRDAINNSWDMSSNQKKKFRLTCLKNDLLYWNKTSVGNLECRASWLANELNFLQRKEKRSTLTKQENLMLKDYKEAYLATLK